MQLQNDGGGNSEIGAPCFVTSHAGRSETFFYEGEDVRRYERCKEIVNDGTVIGCLVRSLHDCFQYGIRMFYTVESRTFEERQF